MFEQIRTSGGDFIESDGAFFIPIGAHDILGCRALDCYAHATHFEGDTMKCIVMNGVLAV